MVILELSKAGEFKTMSAKTWISVLIAGKVGRRQKYNGDARANLSRRHRTGFVGSMDASRIVDDRITVTDCGAYIHVNFSRTNVLFNKIVRKDPITRRLIRTDCPHDFSKTQSYYTKNGELYMEVEEF